MMGAMDKDTAAAPMPLWERRCLQVMTAGWAVEVLCLLVWPFAPHGNGWAAAFLVGAALFFGGVAAGAILRRYVGWRTGKR